MSKLEQILREMEDESLPTHDLGYDVEVPDDQSELESVAEGEDWEEKMDEEEDSEEMEMSEETEQEMNLPTSDLGYEEEVPEGELEELVGDEPMRDESDEMDLGQFSAEIANEEYDEEEDEELVKLVDEALSLIVSQKSKKKIFEEMDELEEEEEAEEEEEKELSEASCDDKEQMEEAEEEEKEAEMMEESFKKLFEGAKISKSFQEKTKTIFTALVNEKVNVERQKLHEAYKLVVKYQHKQKENQLAEQVSNYLDYVVEEWMEKNKVAIESGLQTQIAEQFMQGLKGLFKRHYVEVPESKKDLVEHLEKKTKLLEEKLQKQIQSNVQMKKTLKETSKHIVIKEASTGLTESQKERLKMLSENLEFGTITEFRERIETLKESFINEKPKKEKANARMTKSGISLNEAQQESPEDAEVSAYLTAFKNSKI